MTLWSDWGLSSDTSKQISEEKRLERENRWRRSWILGQSRKAVRKWIQDREGIQ